ncbi:MAG: hypothetical protein U0166_17040 [Acidobacteriota bacterium]
MAAEIARFDIDAPAVMVRGVVHRRVLRSSEEYLSASGPMRIERSLYSSRAKGERTICPMYLRAGVVGGRWTPLAAKQAAWVVGQMTPYGGEELFRRMGGMSPSKSSLDRLPKEISERWEGNRMEFERLLREGEDVPATATAVMASLDGVMVPLKDGGKREKRARAKTEGKMASGPAGFGEAGCGTVTFFDKAGERLRTIRWAPMPEKNKATLRDILIGEVTTAPVGRPDLKLVKVADGVEDNWNFLSRELPAGEEAVDFPHAVENMQKGLVAAYGEKSPAGEAQFRKLRHLLRDDANGVEKVIRALIHLRDKHPRRTKLANALKYFRTHRHRMHYAELKSKNLPIGSGVTEAACKTLATQRLRRSGMKWGEDGGQAVLTLRSLAQSDRFDRGWRLVHGTYCADVVAHDVTTAKRRAA